MNVEFIKWTRNSWNSLTNALWIHEMTIWKCQTCNSSEMSEMHWESSESIENFWTAPRITKLRQEFPKCTNKNFKATKNFQREQKFMKCSKKFWKLWKAWRIFEFPRCPAKSEVLLEFSKCPKIYKMYQEVLKFSMEFALRI